MDRNLVQALMENDLEYLQVLVMEGTYDLDARDRGGDTLLHVAARCSNIFALFYLVQHCGLDIFARNLNGESPMDVASSEDVRAYLGDRVEQCEQICQLLAMAALDDVSAMIISGKFKINDIVRKGRNRLVHVAAEYGNIEALLRLLFDLHADIRIANENGDRALHIAADTGNPEMVRALCECCNAEVDAPNNRNDTALHTAVNNGHHHIVKILVEDAHANPNVPGNNGNYPLHIAASHGDIASTMCLIEHGADVFCVNGDRKQPLALAIENGRSEVLQYLLGNTRANIQSTSDNGRSLLLAAQRAGQDDVVKVLVENGATVNPEVLHAAFAMGSVESVLSMFSSLGCDVDTAFEHGNTALHFACGYGNLQVVAGLIENGANIIVSNLDGNRPLHLAVENNRIHVVKHLVEQRRARIDDRNNNGDTAMHLAARANHMDIVKYLAGSCAVDPEITNTKNKTAIDVAASPQIQGYLYDLFHAPICTQDRQLIHQICAKGDVEHCKYIISQNPKAAFVRSNSNFEPWRYAITHDRVEIVYEFVTRGLVDVNATRDCFGNTLLHIAATAGAVNVMEYLTNNGADIHAMLPITRYQPLHTAALASQLAAVQLLLKQHGIQVNAVAQHGYHPLHCALGSENSSFEVVQALVLGGADVHATTSSGHTAVRMGFYKDKDIYAFLFDVAEHAMLIKCASKAENDNGHA